MVVCMHICECGHGDVYMYKFVCVYVYGHVHAYADGGMHVYVHGYI